MEKNFLLIYSSNRSFPCSELYKNIEQLLKSMKFVVREDLDDPDGYLEVSRKGVKTFGITTPQFYVGTNDFCMGINLEKKSGHILKDEKITQLIMPLIETAIDQMSLDITKKWFRTLECMSDEVTELMYENRLESTENVFSEKQKIYYKILSDVLRYLSSPEQYWHKSYYFEANLICNLHHCFIKKEFSEEDIYFLCVSAYQYVERSSSKIPPLYRRNKKRIAKLFALVPENLKLKHKEFNWSAFEKLLEEDQSQIAKTQNTRSIIGKAIEQIANFFQKTM